MEPWQRMELVAAASIWPQPNVSKPARQLRTGESPVLRLLHPAGVCLLHVAILCLRRHNSFLLV